MFGMKLEVSERSLIHYEEDDLLPVSEEETQLQNLKIKSKKRNKEWEENKEKMNFLYKNKIDPRVLTYLGMDDDEKARSQIRRCL